jgi:hypothetical protein
MSLNVRLCENYYVAKGDKVIKEIGAQSNFVHAELKTTGRPPYNPADLLKLYIYNQGYMLMRGIEKVAGEMSLSILAYNIRRGMNIVGLKGLIFAV